VCFSSSSSLAALVLLNILLFFTFISSFVAYTKYPPPVIPDSTGQAPAENTTLWSLRLSPYMADSNHHVYPPPQRAWPSLKPARLQVTHLGRHASGTITHSVSDVLQPGMIFQTCESTRVCPLLAPTLLSSHRITESELQAAPLLPRRYFTVPNRTAIRALSALSTQDKLSQLGFTSPSTAY